MVISLYLERVDVDYYGNMKNEERRVPCGAQTECVSTVMTGAAGLRKR